MYYQIKIAEQALTKTKALEDMKKAGTNTLVIEKESELQEFLKNKVQF